MASLARRTPSFSTDVPHNPSTNPTPQSWGPPTTYATKSDKIVCVLVGLPARGKSYIARRLSQYVQFFYGAPTKVFNVGEYRRKVAGAQYKPASFFDPKNEEGMKQRRQAAEQALEELTHWMAEVAPHRVDATHDDLFLSGDFGAVAIYDATNSTRERREWLVQRLTPTGAKIIFIESICSDPERIKENIERSKVNPSTTKDYTGVDTAEATTDFEERIRMYEAVYETLGSSDVEKRSYNYIKLVDGGREVSLNNIRGFLPSRIAQFLVNLHTQRRSFFFSRHGQSEYNRLGKIGGDSDLTEHGEAYASALGEWSVKNVMHDEEGQPVPARLWTSSLLRTRRTARHIPHPNVAYSPGEEPTWVQMRPKAFRNLDEIYAGLCDGMTYEQIAETMPEEAKARKANKFLYRYPRGESYTDLIARLEPLAHELERLREPIFVVAHQAILRVLYAYFMGFPREDCIKVSIPLNTVIELTPCATGCIEKRTVVLEPPKGEVLDPASH
jgi:broad specificity phosphatase PhoE